ncbi:glycosyltransferase [Oscillatoria amoena NRMC-F 0135]|nr:glycosyltransferase [Oscillatoria amoena NRMC-F 0135]
MIAHAFAPENLIGAYRPARFARYLPEFGYEPWILTASTQEPPLPPRLREVPFRYNPLELLLGKTFFPHDDRMSWAPRATREAAAWIPSFPAPPLLFSTSPPLASHWAAWRLARRFRLPWVADFRDPLVANFGRRSFLGRLVDPPIERRTVERASAIIMNTAAAADELRTRYPVHAHKITALPNGYDPNDGFQPLPIPPREKRIWFHGGSIYRNRYLQRLLDALWRLTSSGKLPSGWQLRLLGLIEDLSVLESPSAIALRQQGALSVRNEFVPQAQALREAAEADATMVFDHYHDSGANLAIPAKSFDCVRAGRPILAFTSPGAPLDQMLAACGVPSVRIYEQDAPAAIDEKLLAFAALPPEITPFSEAFRQAHSAPEQTRSLAALFDKLLRS